MTLAVIAGGGCAGGDAVVASVGRQSISKASLDHWTAVELAADGENAPGAAELRNEALGLLISWEWTLGEARKLGVRVGTSEAGKQLALSKTDLLSGVSYEWFDGESKLGKYLMSTRVTTPDQLWLVRLAMLSLRLAQSRAVAEQSVIGRARIGAYYQRNKHLFYVGERRDIRAIMNKSRAQVIEAKRQLQAGVRFQAVAERFNQSIEGGLRLGRARGDGTKRYEKDYFAAPLHVLVGPLKEILYYVFEVMSVRPGHQKTLAEAEPAIRQRLAVQDASTALLKAYEHRWRAITSCRAGYTAPGCGQAPTAG